MCKIYKEKANTLTMAKILKQMNPINIILQKDGAKRR